MSRTDMTNSAPRQIWSLNLTSLQTGLTLVATFGIVIGLAWGTVAVAGGMIFDQRLEDFHTTAVPAIEKMMDDKIEMQRLEIERDRLQLLRDLDKRLATIEGLLQEMRESRQ